ncbi:MULTISPECIES: hypothetical protein [Halorussus]|uniref:Uncharacterized protein n=2 Tax=Halobacteriales TaxID=2235 RepID=A0ABD5Q7T8_9EURY|nr:MULTISPECIES: hypothetical protein [Halorussus]USZ78534.1 hypothetical protein NGM07_23905 [Halorussus vallis]
MTMTSKWSWLPYAGVGGAVVCCLAIELLGGAVILGGIAAAVGLSTGLTYLLAVGLGGMLAGLLAISYHRIEGVSHGTLG